MKGDYRKKAQPPVPAESALLQLIRQTEEHHEGGDWLIKTVESVEREATPAALAFGVGVFNANEGEALSQPLERLLLAKNPEAMALWDRLTTFCEESQRSDGRFPQDAVTQVVSANRDMAFWFGLAVGFRLGSAR